MSSTSTRVQPVENARFEVKQGKDQKWYWHLWSSSDIVADGGQGYATKEKAVQGIKTVQRVGSHAPIAFTDV